MAAPKRKNTRRNPSSVTHDRTNQPIARKKNRMNRTIGAATKDSFSEVDNEGEVIALKTLLSLSETDKQHDDSAGGEVSNKESSVEVLTHTPEQRSEPMVPITGINDEYDSVEEGNSGGQNSLLFGCKEKEKPMEVGNREVQNMLAEKKGNWKRNGPVMLVQSSMILRLCLCKVNGRAKLFIYIST